MSGIKVMLNRTGSDGVTADVRAFENGEYWAYTNNNDGTLRTIRVFNKEGSVLVEFVVSAVESVEFA